MDKFTVLLSLVWLELHSHWSRLLSSYVLLTFGLKRD